VGWLVLCVVVGKKRLKNNKGFPTLIQMSGENMGTLPYCLRSHSLILLSRFFGFTMFQKKSSIGKILAQNGVPKLCL
jgi:hypothetical protein